MTCSQKRPLVLNGSRFGVQTRTGLRCKTFDYEVKGGIFTGSKTITHYLVKPKEPIPLQLLRKTRLPLKQGRLKTHPLSGDPINRGQVPFGFKDVNGTLQEDPLEQFVLKQIQKMREKGSSLNQIVRHLMEASIPTKNGGEWQANTVNQILLRPPLT